MNDDDDKPTVVLDLNKLKQELDQKKGSASIIEQEVDINFSSSPDEETSKNIVFFEQEGFNTLSNLADDSVRLIRELSELNKAIKEKKLNLVFYYGENQKVVSALLKQINTKKLNINTILLAKNLSQDKVNIHKDSPFGAKHYLSYPATLESIEKVCI